MKLTLAQFITIKNKPLYQGIHVRNIKIEGNILYAYLIRKNIKEDTMYSIHDKVCVRVPINIIGDRPYKKMNEHLEFMDIFLNTNPKIKKVIDKWESDND